MIHAVQLKVGKRCNNNCVFCEDAGIKAEHDRSLDEIRAELERAKSLGSTAVKLPCNSDMRQDFFEILDISRTLGLSVRLNTNGRIFRYRSFMASALPYLDQVVVQVCGTDEHSHDAVTRVPGSYRQTMNGILNLRRTGFRGIRTLDWSPRPPVADIPNEVVIEVTARCNFACGSCFNRLSFAASGRTESDMPYEKVREIIDAIRRAGVHQVRFSGGEPLLREDIMDLMAYAQSLGLRVWLNTNGSLVTEALVHELEKYVENVLLPFNGYDDGTDLGWTKADGSFQSKLRAAQLLVASRIPVVRAGTVATEENINNLDRIFSLIQETGVSSWELYRPIPLTRGDPALDAERLYAKLVRFSLGWGRLIPLVNAVPFCSIDPLKMDLVSTGACHDDGHTRLVIDPAGFAKPSYFINKDIGDPRDILACWNHEFMQRMRACAFAPGRCQGCPWLTKCRGGSRYVANLVSGCYDGEDPLMRGFAPHRHVSP